MPNISVTCNQPKEKKSFTVSFRHPVVKDKGGKYGLKVHRSLKTNDENVARDLISQIEKIVNDDTWWSLAKRNEAYDHFPEIAVNTFYDPMESEAFDEEKLLDRIKLPEKSEGYIRATLLGPSGAGKTSLLRMLVGTAEDKFPTTSSGRTTTCNMEFITSPSDTYELVVTFMSRHVTEMYVQECIESALQYCKEHPDKADKREVAEKLLSHRDLIVRLAYILGDYSLLPKDIDNEDLDEEFAKNREVYSPENVTELLSIIDEFVEKVISIAKNISENYTDDDIQEYDFEDNSEVLSLRDDMVTEISKRFSGLKGGEKINSRGDWVNGWYFKSTNRYEFLQIAKLFSSNEKKKWGSLLTPIVKTLRIKGNFTSAFDSTNHKMVLFDGQGLGHKTAATSIPTEIVKYFRLSDSIILVDNALAPILDNVKLALRTAIENGYSDKVAFAFTHVDLMDGDNFCGFNDKKTHIITALKSYIADLKQQNEIVLTTSEADTICKSCFFFSDLNRVQVSDLAQKNAEKMLLHLKQLYKTNITGPDVILEYDAMTLYMHLQVALDNYRNTWNEIIGYPNRSDKTEHWSRIKALSRRLAYFEIDNYNNQLSPISDFRQELSRQLNLFFNKPLNVLPSETPEEIITAKISEFKKIINAQLIEFSKNALWQESEQKARWQDAYGYRDRYSTYLRSSKINDIFELGAPRIGNFAYDLSESQKHCIAVIFQIIEKTLGNYGCKLERFGYVDSFR